MDLRVETAKIVEGINQLHSDISTQDWGNAKRLSFVGFLDSTISNLKKLESHFEKAATELESGTEMGAPSLNDLRREFDAIMPVLENNLKLEKTKKSTAKESNVFEQEENGELYSDLAEKIQTLLLRARYNAERINVFGAKQGSSPLEGKSTAKQMLDLLQVKEKEIEEVKEKYENIRKKSYLGYVQEGTSVDLEHDLGSLSMKMGESAAELRKEISLHKSQIEYIENSYAQLRQRLDSLEEIFSSYVEKSMELISMLKKERDYAKKVVLDVEHETLQLRNRYTNEMLSLQENKLRARKEGESKFRKELDELKKRLKEKEELAAHFRKMSEDKHEKEKELEEKVKKLTLLLKTKEKHDAVKKHFKKKTAAKIKRKKKK